MMRLVRIGLWLLLAAITGLFAWSLGHAPTAIWAAALFYGARWAFLSPIDPSAPVIPARRSHKCRAHTCGFACQDKQS
jgi:hypothetical protein